LLRDDLRISLFFMWAWSDVPPRLGTLKTTRNRQATEGVRECVRRITLFFAVVALLAVGLGVLHHLRGARFQISLTPRSPLTLSECSMEIEHFGYNPDAFEGGCAEGQGRPWYHAVVRNTGHRGAWVVGCMATGRDGSGHVLPGLAGFDVPMWMTAPGVGARPHLDPGQSASLDWFVPAKGAVDHYAAVCSLIVYSNPPV
jgi:hypothetical protein